MAKEQAPAGYVNALDGLRAICALGVVGYHMNLTWMQGGFHGVTVLLVLSGYLITAGLLKEYFGEGFGTINLKRFYLKRIWRLMPTVTVFIVVTAALCVLFSHLLLTKMRTDILPGFFMIINWTKIFANESYFAAAGAPSPLTHFWTLAIEAQFYLIWPLILLVLFKFKCRKKQLTIVIAVLTVISAVSTAVLYVPGQDPTRVYYGLDTRAQSLLLGALLALIWPFHKMGKAHIDEMDSTKALVVRILGVVCLVGLIALFVVTDGYSSFSYYGGIFLVSLLSVGAAAALTPHGTILGKILSFKPLTWIGKRSYAVYIWHYPILELLNPRNATTPTPWWVLLLELALILVVAELSYRFVEHPMRHGWPWKSPKALKKERAAEKKRLAKFMHEGIPEIEPLEGFEDITAAAIASVEQTADERRERASAARVHQRERRVGDGQRKRPTRRRSEQLPDGRSRRRPPQDGQRRRRSSGSKPTAPGNGKYPTFGSWLRGHIIADACVAVVCAIAIIGCIVVEPVTAAGNNPNDKVVTQATLKKPLVDGVYDVVLVGDSVSLGANAQLNEAFPHGMIDSKGSRQAPEALEVYKGYADKGVVGDTVIFSVGTNGMLDTDMLDSMVETVGADKQIWFINIRVPETRMATNNQVIQQTVDKYENVNLIDWATLTSGHDDYLGPDGIHLTWVGRDAFSKMVVDTIGYVLPTEENTTYDMTVIGDAICLDAADGLATLFPKGAVDAAAGRKCSDVPELLNGYIEKKVLGKRVMFCIGNEEPLTQDIVEQLIGSLEADVEIWFVNNRAPGTWCEANNTMLANVAGSHDNVKVIDWYTASTGHDDWFTEDGMHLTAAGADAYNALVAQSLGIEQKAAEGEQ